MKPGTRVRMTGEFKHKMRGPCGVSNKHLGPFVFDDRDDTPTEEGQGTCVGCSSEHIDEFGECEGIVIGLLDYNRVPKGHKDYDLSKVGPEVDVRWEPSKLRYAYSTYELEEV